MPNVTIRFRVLISRPYRQTLLKAGLPLDYPKVFPGDSEEPSFSDGGELSDNILQTKEGTDKLLFDPGDIEPLKSLKGLELKFAFWSVIGAAKATDHNVDPPNALSLGPNGSFYSTHPKCPWIEIGSADVVATAWYIIDDGSVAGVVIDAFDVDHGEPVLDDFVTIQKVLGPGKVEDVPELTKKANDEGSVSTSEFTVNILAYPEITSPVPPVPFREWFAYRSLPVGSIFVNHKAPLKKDTPGGGVLTAPKSSAGVAVAFFSTRKLATDWTEPILGVRVTYGVAVDGGGRVWTPHGPSPIDPWGPSISELIMGSVLAQMADKVNPELRARLLEISEEQVSRAADAIAKRGEARSKTGWLRRAAPVLRNVARVGLEVLGVAAALLLARGCGLFR